MKFEVLVTASRPVFQTVLVDADTAEAALDLAANKARATPELFEECQLMPIDLFAQTQWPDGTIVDGSV